MRQYNFIQDNSTPGIRRVTIYNNAVLEPRDVGMPASKGAKLEINWPSARGGTEKRNLYVTRERGLQAAVTGR